MVIALLVALVLSGAARAQERPPPTVEEIAVQMLRNGTNDQATSAALLSLLQDENRKLKETIDKLKATACGEAK